MSIRRKHTFFQGEHMKKLLLCCGIFLCTMHKITAWYFTFHNQSPVPITVHLTWSKLKRTALGGHKQGACKTILPQSLTLAPGSKPQTINSINCGLNSVIFSVDKKNMGKNVYLALSKTQKDREREQWKKRISPQKDDTTLREDASGIMYDENNKYALSMPADYRGYQHLTYKINAMSSSYKQNGKDNQPKFIDFIGVSVYPRIGP